MPSAKTLFIVVSIIFTHALFVWLGNKPQYAGPDVPAGKLRSLSFAPYHRGFSPIDETFPLPAHIEQDIQAIADKTYTIRTYSVRGGMQPTPDFARQHGVNMLMGAWLGDNPADNQLEIDALIKAANANPDIVKRVIVGNEVLLRKDLTIDQLIATIRQVKQAIKQPVSFADVWSSYLQYPQLFKEVDFITIHILPYWEDEPVAIEHAAQHVETIVKQIEAKARSLGIEKPILIGESGWPSLGRQRGAAVPSVVNSARFVRELIAAAERHGFDYNIVEAFNQDWKSQSEGVVGANWGLFDQQRQPVFPLTGPVREQPQALWHFAYASGLFLLAIGLYRKTLRQLNLLQTGLWLVLAQIFSISLVELTHLGWTTSYTLWQQIYIVCILLINIGLAYGWLQRCADILLNRNTRQSIGQMIAIAYGVLTLLALIKSCQLGWNGRYLSFSVEQFAIAAQGVLGIWLCVGLTQNRFKISFTDLGGYDLGRRWHRALAYLLPVSLLGVVMGETYGFMSAYDFIQAHPLTSEGLPVALGYSLQNQQLLGWLLCGLILSMPYWWPSREPSTAVILEKPITITRL